MRRRDFVAVFGGTMLAGRVPTYAQQSAIPVIGWLSATEGSQRAPFIAAFRAGLGEIGYVEGQNVAIEYRFARGRYDQLPSLAADLVSRKVDVIVAAGGPRAPAIAAKNATSMIAIVFTGVSDPVAIGLVPSLARPGANITGFALLVGELAAKRLELISELVPETRSVGFLVNPKNATSDLTIRDIMQAGARVTRVQLHVLRASTETEIGAAFVSLIQKGAGVLVVAADPFFESRRDQLVGLASRHAVPTIYAFREYVDSGGLISYGVSLLAVDHEVGIYVGRILNGTKPADLPVQQPTKFELVINLKTAKALGLAAPQSILARADEVIE